MWKKRRGTRASCSEELGGSYIEPPSEEIAKKMIDRSPATLRRVIDAGSFCIISPSFCNFLALRLSIRPYSDVTASKADIRNLLDRLLNGSPALRECEELAALCVKQAAAFLRLIINRHSYRVDGFGMTLDGIAADMLGELLAGDESGPCAELRVSLLRSDDTASVEARTYAILYRTVQQNLPRLFAEHDPVRSKLLRSIRRSARTDEEIRTITAAGGRIYCHRRADPRLHLPAIPYEQLLLFLHDRGRCESTFRGLFRSILLKASELETCRAGIGEHELLQALVENAAGGYEQEIFTENPPDSSTEDADLTGAVDGALQATLEWVEHAFIAAGKLDRTEAEAILSACRAYMLDTAYDRALGLYRYMREQMPALSQAEYRSKYRNRCEYILRRLFRSVGDVLVRMDVCAP